MLTEQNVCPNCGGVLTKNWRGYLIVLDHTRSEIAKRMSITTNGRFALRVK
jgi:DNA-directed RNA polymerase subunit E"